MTDLEDGTPAKRYTFLSARAHAQTVRKGHGNIVLSARPFCSVVIKFCSFRSVLDKELSSTSFMVEER